MYKNKFGSRNNIAGLNVAAIRKEKNWSQQELAVKLQNINHDVGKNGIQELESGTRFVTDIELVALSKVLNVSVEKLLDTSSIQVANYDKSDAAFGLRQIASPSDEY